jgi:hypothetical protein
MSRLLAIITPLCLALSLSFSMPAFAQQARQNTTARPAASCTTTTTKTLSGTVTVWTDNFEFPGPASNTVSASIVLDSSTGAVCSFSFASFTLTDPSTGNTITVVKATPASNPGQFTASTGALVLNGTLTLDNLPLIQGQVTTKQGSLSTDSTITASDGTTHSGARLGSGNSIALVGTTSFTDFITVHLQTSIVGTLS